MSLPTLLKPGYISVEKWMSTEEKRALVTDKSIDWLMKYISQRVSINKSPPKINPKTIGDKVGILRSGTGTGKSTVIPPELYRKFMTASGKLLVCTQPTVLTTMEIPSQIVQYNKDLIMRKNIGYQTGPLSQKISSGIIFMTVGILVQVFKANTDDEIMKRYMFILIDEIHIQTDDRDKLLSYIKGFLQRNYKKNECPYFILMSGTFDPEVLMEYFECSDRSFINITGNSFPITDNYTKSDIGNYLAYITDLVAKIHIDNYDADKNEPIRDIIVFLQGTMQIKLVANYIHWLNANIFSKSFAECQDYVEKKYERHGGDEHTKYICIIELLSENVEKNTDDYKNLFTPSEFVTTPIYETSTPGEIGKLKSTQKAFRRVILSTMVAETGLTISTLKYCIDSGYVQENQFNPSMCVNTFVNKCISQANVIQRRGRVGRKAPGVFYACYTKESFDALPKNPLPDVVKNDISSIILDLIINMTGANIKQISRCSDNDATCFQKNTADSFTYELVHENNFNVEDLNLIKLPPADNCIYAIQKLHALGLIDQNYNVTLFGFLASRIQKLSLESIRMIFAGYYTGANVLDLITIAAFAAFGPKLGIKRGKYTPRNPYNVNVKKKTEYYADVVVDDFIEYVFIFEDIQNMILDRIGTKKMSFSDVCDEIGISSYSAAKAIELRNEIIVNLTNIGMNPFYNSLDLNPGKYNLSRILRENFDDGFGEIIKIKKCIYDGYKLNVYIWDDVARKYKSFMCHNYVSLDEQTFVGRKIIVGNVRMRYNATIYKYEFSGSIISKIDDIPVDAMESIY